MRSPLIVALVIMALLPACTVVEAEQPAPPRQLIATCDAGEARQWIGLRPGDVPLAEAQIIRVLAPGQKMTMDYRVERLNLFLTADGIIQRVTCG